MASRTPTAGRQSTAASAPADPSDALMPSHCWQGAPTYVRGVALRSSRGAFGRALRLAALPY